MIDRRLLQQALEQAVSYLEGLHERRVGSATTPGDLAACFGGLLPKRGEAPPDVLRALVEAAEPGLVATAGPRYFGFVNGGSLPAALAADWLTSAWDQNAAAFVMSPAAAAAEAAVSEWLLSLLRLPQKCSVGLVTGGQGANTTGLAAARHAVLRRVGWDVEADGLQGAPAVTVIVGEQAHVTVFASLRLLGLGARRVLTVPADDQGRMRAAALRAAIATCDGPTIVCVQAGNVNTGAFDPFDEIVAIARERNAWVHVDGAFGLWAAASAATRTLTAGMAGADSWAVDLHKWLNVPYDCGVAIVRDQLAHRAAMSFRASYLVPAPSEGRDNYDWVPESSRRARAFAAWAALRSLGRGGVEELIDRCCAHARHFAALLREEPGVRLLNDVVLNQTLVRFESAQGRDGDAFTRGIVDRVQRDGTCWLGGTTWQGRTAMRISVVNWATTSADVERSAQSILRAKWAEEEAAPQ